MIPLVFIMQEMQHWTSAYVKFDCNLAFVIIIVSLG